MEDFSSRYAFVRALKNTFIVHVLVILFLFLYYNPPSLIFSPEKAQEKDALKKEQQETQVLIEFDKKEKQPPQKPKASAEQKKIPPLENMVVPLPPHTPEREEPLALPTTIAPQPQQNKAQAVKASQAAKQQQKPEAPPLAQPAPPTPPTAEPGGDNANNLAPHATPQEKNIPDAYEQTSEKAPIMFDTTHHAPTPSSGSGTPRSFADLARGFMQHVEQENSNGTSTGNAAQAQVQQILHDTYHAKVYGLLKQAVNTERPQLYIHNTSNEQATLLLKIARNGALLCVSIHHPAKKDGTCTLGTLAHDLQSIEATLSRIAKSVGLYPPLPKAFAADTISITFPIGINTQQGFYSYFMT